MRRYVGAHRRLATTPTVARVDEYIPPEADWADQLPRFPADESGKSVGKLSDKLDLSNSALSPAAQTHLRNIIDTHRAAFVLEDGAIGRYTGAIRHRIDLVPGAAPTAQRPYRTPIALREEVKRQIEDMLRQRIIEPSTSPFCAPIVLVRKADKKSYRFAIDYRKLNAITQKQTYYLPLISDLIDLVGGKKIFTTLDFQAGFHQIPVQAEHVERTAFACWLGLFQFITMPFGLVSAPSTFQKVMESLRKEISAAFFVYLDDVIIASDTEEQHLDNIQQFLQIIIKYGMKHKLEKCNFGQQEIKYLGFLISQEGIRADPKNLKVVVNFNSPTTLTELKSLLGAFSYFRRFIRNFAQIAKPLYALTKKDTFKPESWTKEQQ